MTNNYRPYINLLIITCSFFLFGCEKKIDFQYDSLTITTEDIKICKVQNCPKIVIDYVAFDQPEVLATSVNGWIKAQMGLTFDPHNGSILSIEENLENYINSLQTAYPETTEYSDSYEFTAEMAISYASNDVLSMVYHYYEFNGGAHGYERMYYVNFNPKNGLILEHFDLLDPDFYAFAKAEFQRTHPNIPFEIEEKTFNGASDNSIGFSQEGLIVRYKDLYAIPISDESYELTISWDIAQDYLTF